MRCWYSAPHVPKTIIRANFCTILRHITMYIARWVYHICPNYCATPNIVPTGFWGSNSAPTVQFFSGALQLELGCHCVFAQCGECSCLAFYLSTGPSSSHGAEEPVVKHRKPHTAKRPHCSSDLYGGSNLKLQHHPNNSATKPRSGILMLHPWRQGQL